MTRQLLVDQSGVVSRAQLLGEGMQPHDIARLLRRRELVQVHRGVYLDHTGPPTWLQQAWAAVLLCWPAALSHESAMRAYEGPGRRASGSLPGPGHGSDPARVVHVAVDRDRRTPRAPRGVVVHRTVRLEERAQWNLGPPRLRYEEAVLDDVAAGVSSVLEHGYLTRVERPHGLSGAQRQVRDRAGAGVVYRDVEYDGGVVVELDGRLFHDTTGQRDRDFDRDLEAAANGKRTVRLSYGQVFQRPCRTAGLVAAVLGRPTTPCGPDCEA